MRISDWSSDVCSSDLARRAMLLGLKSRCPSCGGARLFARYLKPVDACPACGQDWTHQRADDLPAYLVILLLGPLILPLVVGVNRWVDWKRVVVGKGGVVTVDFGGRLNIKKKKK